MDERQHVKFATGYSFHLLNLINCQRDGIMFRSIGHCSQRKEISSDLIAFSINMIVFMPQTIFCSFLIEILCHQQVTLLYIPLQTGHVVRSRLYVLLTQSLFYYLPLIKKNSLFDLNYTVFHHDKYTEIYSMKEITLLNPPSFEERSDRV